MKYWKYTFFLLTLVIFILFLGGFSLDNDLRIISCDVGQGDATLIIYKNTEIVIDGGPNSKVIECMSQYIPFWDRKIELVILTHPEADHYTGLIDVFKSYDIDSFLVSDLVVSSESYNLLKRLVGGGRTRVVRPTNSMVIRLGSIYLDMVIDEEVRIGEQKDKLNLYSIISVLKFSKFEAVLTGDYEFNGKDNVLEDIKQKISSEGVIYIKTPHHGSKNGLTQSLLEITRPKFAIVSVGKNQWGHPVGEVLDMITKAGAKVFRTDLNGNIEVIVNEKGNYKVKTSKN